MVWPLQPLTDTAEESPQRRRLTGLHHTSRFAMPASATMAHYRAATFAGIGGGVFILAEW